MVTPKIIKTETDKSVLYDLSPIVTTLKVAKMKNLQKGNNLIYQMLNVLKDLSIIENSNFYDTDNINSFYNMISKTDNQAD